MDGPLQSDLQLPDPRESADGTVSTASKEAARALSFTQLSRSCIGSPVLQGGGCGTPAL